MSRNASETRRETAVPLTGRKDKAPPRAAAARSADAPQAASAKDIGFRSDPITDMVAVGAVGPHSARLWIRCERPARLELRYTPVRGGAEIVCAVDARDCGARDRTLTVDLPGPDAPPLEPGCHYRYQVRMADGDGDGDGVLGDGRFETAPATADEAPDRFAFAMMSCHQPFKENGKPSKDSAEMLEAAVACLEHHDVKFALMMGDQMYTDYPRRLSLFDDKYFERVKPPGFARIEECREEDVRAMLQLRHRYFWNVEGWRKLHARFPCYPMVDDHEIVDNWGAVEEHRNPGWQAFLRGARAAYFDYQGSRVAGDAVPEDFDYEIEWGPLAIRAIDLRSNRCVGNDDARILSPRQHRNLLDFLDRHRGREVIGLLLSVPAVHLPRWAASLGSRLTPGNEDFSDRWSTAGHIDDRDRVLKALHRHQRENPEQRILLLSGDIHLACAHALKWTDGMRPLLQLIASGITHAVGPTTRVLAKASILANQKVELGGTEYEARVRLLKGTPHARKNPFTKLNLGLVEIERGIDGRYGVRYLIYGHNGVEPVCVYRSPLL